MQHKRHQILLLLVFLTVNSLNIYCVTHTVTNGNDDGIGSLRNAVEIASSGDTIVFASNIATVNLIGSDIIIDKNLTIIGGIGSSKVTITAGIRRIFFIYNPSSSINFTINNLILTGVNYSNPITPVLDYGGAIYANNSTITITNCDFTNNHISLSYGGAIYAYNSVFIAINCTFSNNQANIGQAIMTWNPGTANLYHCTIDNKLSSNGNQINGPLYSYNTIITQNTGSPISESILGSGHNLIGGQNGVTRNLVFGSNTYTNGYIMPLPFAKSATILNNTIQAPSGITVSEILNYLKYDQIGNPRPIIGNTATYGTIEIIVYTSLYL